MPPPPWVTVQAMERQVSIRTPLPPPSAPSTAATPPTAYTESGARVLSEQAYTSAVKTLVESHYFPDLQRLTAENAYLDAVATGDTETIRTAAERLVRAEEQAGRIPPTPKRVARGAQTPPPPLAGVFDTTPRGPLQRGWATPAGSDTPKVNEEEVLPPPEPEDALGEERTTPLSSSELRRLTLDQFTKRFTSTDNASFTEIVKRTNSERRHKYAWAFVEEHKQKRKFLAARQDEQQGARKGRRLALAAAPEPRLIESASSSSAELQDLVRLEGSRGPQNAPNALAESVGEGATPTSWPFQARNSLMFPPPGLPASAASTSGPQPSIIRRNTRLPDLPEDADNALESGSVLALTPIGTTPRTDFTDDTPVRTESYPFLSPLPEPSPGAPGSARLDQLLAWSTQQKQQTPRNEFTKISGPRGFVPPPSRRERLATRLLSASTTPSHSRTPRQSPTPHTHSGTPRHILSPAGRDLLQRATDRTASPLARSLLGPRAHRRATRRSGDQPWTPRY